MKGSWTRTTSEPGKLYRVIGVTVDVAHLMTKPEVVEIHVYNDAGTTYRKAEDGTWTRSFIHGTRKPQKVALVEGKVVVVK